MRLTFGKHLGKTITELVNEEEYSYIVWLEEVVEGVEIDKHTYLFCKNEVFKGLSEHEAIMDSIHGDWGNRD